MILSIGKRTSPTAAWTCLDDGRLWIRASDRQRFLDRGWRTVADIMSASVHVFRQLAERENALIIWPDGRRDYLKRHREKRRRSFTPLRTTLFKPAGMVELKSAEECRSAGIPIADVVAAGFHCGSAAVESFFISEELRGFMPADDFWKEHLRNGDEGARRSFLSALARVARQLHCAGLYHRDLYWCHFFARKSGGDYEIKLIDLQRVFRPRWREWRWRIKDLAQFIMSAPEGALDQGLMPHWFTQYLERPRLRMRDRLLLRLIRMRAWLYRRGEEAR